MRKKSILMIFVLLNVIGLVANIYCGSASIAIGDITDVLTGKDIGNSAISYIVIHSRIPASVTALLTGASLGVCGLLLQGYFRNPLAGPSILGITSGANLAVAICTLGFGMISGFTLTMSAMAGAMLILLILLCLSKIVRQTITLLIVGILISYLTNAIITLLNYYSTAEGVQSLLIWGMGNFNGVGSANLLLFCLLNLMGIGMSVFLIKPLNGWMLGQQYAANLGISIARTRLLTLATTGLLSAVTTAYCGPIAFVGLSVPHVARMMMKTDNHRSLLPASALLGAFCTSICLFISTLPSGGKLLPINALTPILGIPVIIYVILCKKN